MKIPIATFLRKKCYKFVTLKMRKDFKSSPKTDMRSTVNVKEIQSYSSHKQTKIIASSAKLGSHAINGF